MIAVAGDVDQYKLWWEEARWEPLMASLVPRVRALLKSRQLDPDTVDDLTQETLVRCWRQKIVPDHPVSFACTVAMNLVRDHAKSARNRLRAADSTSDAAIEQLETPDDDPLEVIIAEADRMLLREALRTIPDKFRRPLVLAAYHKRTSIDLAKQFGSTPAAMRMRLTRARKLLIAALTGEGLPQRRGRTPEYLKVIPPAPAPEPPQYAVALEVTELARHVTVGMELRTREGHRKIATFCLTPAEWGGTVGDAIRTFDPMMAGASASV